MQYSTLRSAYGVNGFEELSRPPKPEPSAQASPLENRDWMSAPPQPVMSSSPPMNIPASYVPTSSQIPSVAPNMAPSMSLPPIPSLPPTQIQGPMPSAFPYDSSWKHPNVHSLQRFDTNLHDVCALCQKRSDREMQLMVIYIASGIFLLAFVDILVRLAMWVAKRK